MTNLVIVESPAKANTIKTYLGSSYKVMASKGHVRDLPKSSLGIDIENDFEPHYINIRGKGDLIKELRREAAKADRVYLATDLDREGEAISWHLAAALKLPEDKIRRITFNEITKSAIKQSIKSPRNINTDLVNAQQARRILDRIVGYKISPFLWKNVRSGLSAGRVQSVATKIIVDRENEIRAFVAKEYWTVDATLETDKKKELTVHYYGSAATGEKTELLCEADAAAVVSRCEGKDFSVRDVKHGTRYKAPAPPFTTSTMQQEASKKLNFQSQRTMKVAQELYEGVNLGTSGGGMQGLITYMRTDSLRIADEARAAAREYIASTYGEKYCPANPRVYKTKQNAEDAHEAIRPSNVNLDPISVKKHLTPDQFKLYRLIWNRFVASQMESAELATVSAEFTCGDDLFKASGYTVKFSGFMAVYEETADTPDSEKGVKLPPIEKDDVLSQKALLPEQHFTEPPARYTEASLVKFLEEKGIGRPSTYTPIITIIISRGYVKREGKALRPTPLGEVTTKLMEESFPDIVNYKFTADMEKSLDGVEAGDETLTGVLQDFWRGFSKELDAAQEKADLESYEVPVEETDIICENCGATMIVKNGRFGKFAACPNYPECKNTKPLNATKEKEEKKLEIAPFKCELCGSDMVYRTGRFGGFYACVRYPECKNTKQKVKSLGVACPKCGKDVVTKHGRNKSVFYSCSGYPECDFSSWDMPTNEKCPDCGEILYVKKGKNQLVCKAEGCSFKKEREITAEESAE
ncbi:MAG: type I DNA topoisomerase [Ruminococcaceae bacterium]|nr:type I DNA topoisomerase [Oscillospiraceae bacterium]